MREQEILKAANFEFTQHLRGVWDNSPFHVPEIHAETYQHMIGKIDDLRNLHNEMSPLEQIVRGIAGAGKTHFLGTIRQYAQEHGLWFVLVDMTDVRDFAETLNQGYLSSLQRPYPKDRPQYETILTRFLNKMGLHSFSLQELQNLDGETTIKKVDEIVRWVWNSPASDNSAFRDHQDILRALLYFHSSDYEVQNIGYSFLLGLELDPEDKRKFYFRQTSKPLTEINKALSWILSQGGSTVLAFDQLDAIVAQHNLAGGTGEIDTLSDEQKMARSIIEGITRGLAALYDQTRRTLVIVSCLETTWDIIWEKTLPAHRDRFLHDQVLRDIEQEANTHKLVERRLSPAFAEFQFIPPYPTWPFHPSALRELTGANPRAILQMCDKARNRLLRQGFVTEITTFNGQETPVAPLAADRFQPLDQQFQRLVAATTPGDVLEESQVGCFEEILQQACALLLKECTFPHTIDPFLDREFARTGNFNPLHARIRLVYRAENDREAHYCLRGLPHANAIAFQNRLRSAMVAAGIDRDLSFRCLRIIRAQKLPSGPKTERMITEFENQNGAFLYPYSKDLSAILALIKLQKMGDLDFSAWHQARRPLSALLLFADLIQWINDKLSQPATPHERQPVNTPVVPEPAPVPPASVNPGLQQPPEPATPPDAPRRNATPPRILIGRRWLNQGTAGDSLYLEPLAFTKHTAILAGAGSGKTVLIKRLVEEATLAGIPSIVIDAANDLARLGDPWPQPPAPWLLEDHTKARQYFEKSEVMIWTPLRSQGNPLHLNPLPDFNAIRDNPDEVESLILLVIESFKTKLKMGAGLTTIPKLGVLTSALHYYVSKGMVGLDSFIELLNDLPTEANGGFNHAHKHAQQMADQLRGIKATNPLMNEQHGGLDPSQLFGLNNPSAKTRISVINFVGLLSLESQQEFLNQLAMTLFTWIKKH
ncbi:MAG: DUF87 domain-containing protein, partial [bacterium]|nr:DUF87 domain-containing protein [bacterium]